MSPLSALLTTWCLTALWPLVAGSAMRIFSVELFAAAGIVVGLSLLSPSLTKGGCWRKIFSRDLALPLFAIGALSSLGTLIYIKATSYTTPANAAIMAQVEVLYSAALCAWWLGERLTFKHSLATLMVLAGTGLIMSRDLSSLRLRGDLMIVATPWMYQVSHIISKRLPQELDALTISGGRLIYGLVLLLPFCLWRLFHAPQWSWEPRDLWIVGAQGAGLSCVNLVLWYTAIRRMELAKATTIMLSYPALTMLFSWGLGWESVYPIQIVGLAITLAGAVWMSRLVAAGLPVQAPAAR